MSPLASEASGGEAAAGASPPGEEIKQKKE